ncbi:epidermal growth factor-like protein 6 isoform X2 [Hemicordylus capensis]|uniref:epidermal growth factor-like protein 6 isoform X2 n=1 Tax=Hemicordylus capensis TaxID=884348 RepID=UPI0023035707|nr:epidermal growth factor-like protein 6 isoform X2 [Hemicordylus capensis]
MVLLVAWSTFFFALSGLPFAAGGFAEAASSRGRRQLLTVNQPGVCRYGSKLDCCYGWKRNSKEHCEDINECGLKPHPCEHRCMNTHGSYKCYCLNGYMLMADGTCTNSRTCAMVNCQYGCEEVKDDVRCLCPSSGLHLAPNGKTCIDIDECSTGKAICSFNRRCVNTFGSYYCKCQIGYELKYVSGRYNCVDINECTANVPKCSFYAECLNTQGSFKCKCKPGYRGNGFECSVIHENSVKEIPRISGVAKEKLKKLLVHKNSVKKHEDIKNVIPEPPVTPASKAHVRPLDYEDSAYIEATYGEQGKGTENARRDGKEEKEAEEEEEERPDLENQTDSEKKLRGDVFSKEAAAFGPAPAQRKIPVQKVELEVDCSFGRGSCAWQQDTNDDFDWNPADHDNGDEYYMAVPAFMGHKKDVGRLNLLLNDLKPKNIYCLIFSYRLAGDRVGKLRVILGNSSSSPSWEQSLGDDDQWRTGQMEVHMGGETTMNITFEAERGKGKSGEIGVDAVVLFSGLCPEDHLTFDT